MARWGRIALTAAVAGVIVAAFLTKDGMPKETSGLVKTHIVRQGDLTQEEENPLLKDAYPEVNALAEEYYEEAAKDAKYADSYEAEAVYTKLGPYENSYLVYVHYKMQIPDIYTKVPGLKTFYVEEDKNGKLIIKKEPADENVSELVGKTAMHEDVKALMQNVHTEYQNAIASDRALQEAFVDLRNAYESEE